MRNSWERDENMSSKKYDANIGTTRQANAAQHDTGAAVLLLFIFLFHVRFLEPVTLSLVLNLEEEGEDECEDTE